MSDQQQSGHVSELTTINYAAMYMPTSMVLLPLGAAMLIYLSPAFEW